MKKLLVVLILGLLLSGNAYAEINWQKRNLCEKSEYKDLCSIILDKRLVGYNSTLKFRWDKGTIIALIHITKGENMSLLADPDKSYVAKYYGEYLVTKSADGVFITQFVHSSIEHFVCDSSNNCIDARKIF